MANNVKTLLTVAIANYNNAAYVGRCIDSVLDQLTDCVEVLVVDDGSTDGSIDVINSQASRCDALRVVLQPNLGVSAARNRAIAQANGTYITFVDSDDEIAPGGLNAICEALRFSRPDVLITDYRICTQSASTERHSLNCPGGLFKRDCSSKLISCCLEGLGFSDRETTQLTGSVWDKAYSVAFLRDSRLMFNPALKHGEDIAFNVRVLRAADSVFYQPTPTYLYYLNEFSVTHSLNPRLLNDIELYLLDIKEQVDDIGDSSLLNDFWFNSINQIEYVCLSGGYAERGVTFAEALGTVSGRKIFADAICGAKQRSAYRYKENLKLILYKTRSFKLLSILLGLKNKA